MQKLLRNLCGAIAFLLWLTAIVIPANLQVKYGILFFGMGFFVLSVFLHKE